MRLFTRCFTGLLTFSVTLFWISLAVAQTAEIMGAKEAFELSKSKQVVVIDIRSREEWKETGIGEHVIPLSMHEKGFLEGYNKILSDNPGKQIALICATGARSHFVQSELSKRSLGSVIDVSEGMLGNQRGKGWIALGLPLKKFE